MRLWRCTRPVSWGEAGGWQGSGSALVRLWKAGLVLWMLSAFPEAAGGFSIVWKALCSQQQSAASMQVPHALSRPQRLGTHHSGFANGER
jgi:hypothetical protein